jgi:hypothetical protein
MSGHFIGAVLVADVRVSFPSGEYDMLRKIHPVAPNLAFGFAGSVQVGFEPQHKNLQLLRSTRPPQQPDQREQVPDNEIHKRPEQKPSLDYSKKHPNLASPTLRRSPTILSRAHS